MKKENEIGQEIKSLEDLKRDYLQEEIDLLESFEIEQLETRVAFSIISSGGCGPCACGPLPTGEECA